MLLNMLNDLAEATKASDGKKSKGALLDHLEMIWHHEVVRQIML